MILSLFWRSQAARCEVKSGLVELIENKIGSQAAHFSTEGVAQIRPKQKKNYDGGDLSNGHKKLTRSELKKWRKRYTLYRIPRLAASGGRGRTESLRLR